jgi:hypothetical protein
MGDDFFGGRTLRGDGVVGGDVTSGKKGRAISGVEDANGDSESGANTTFVKAPIVKMMRNAKSDIRMIGIRTAYTEA